LPTVLAERAWSTVRLLKVKGEQREIPEVTLLHHLVVLNMGDQTETEVRIDGGPWLRHRIAPFGFSVLPAGMRHAARIPSVDGVFLEISAEFAQMVLQSCGSGAGLRLVLCAQDPVVAHIVSALAEVAPADGPIARVQAETLGAALVARLAVLRPNQKPPPHMGGLPSSRLHRVLEHVTSNLDEPATLRTLADLAGMDLYRFVRAFKRSTGLPPHRYVLEARISQAKELLRNPTLSITEIALRTGFATPRHFSVTFRRVTGMTPRVFRQALSQPAGA
jgi:AraC family transcriptional regulator